LSLPVKPSPENQQLYDKDDPDWARFVDSIRRGLKEPLVVTKDNFIVSGHRRHRALLEVGRVLAPCRVLNVRRADMGRDQYLALLREYNRYRHKSVAEQVRESLVDVDPDEAHANLVRRRERSVDAAAYNDLAPVEILGTKKRYGLSGTKNDHARHAVEVLEENRKFWPLSVRGVHYKLLNYDFVRGLYYPRRCDPDWGGPPRELCYANDEGSYGATSDLLTRMRLSGEVPWEALDDFTRPYQPWRAFRNVRTFVRQEVRRLFDGYWRDLLQSQPNHIEVLCEKNTVYHLVQRVARKYTIPVMSGRGYNSIDPYHDLYERYKSSRKQGLILIPLTDHDPEGQDIIQVAGRTLRDDFGMVDCTLLGDHPCTEGMVSIFQAGVTREQVERYDLAQDAISGKDTSSRYNAYVERNREWFESLGWEEGEPAPVWELEALDPQHLLDDLEKVIRGVLDMQLFNSEARRETEESVELEAWRRAAQEALKGLV
jgi:hypothetical protein